jgi:hypothetical protein
MTETLKAAGPIKAGDLWTRIRTTESFRPCMERSGITDAMLDEFGAALARTDLAITAEGGAVVVYGKVDSEPVRARLAPRVPSKALPHDATDVIASGRFLALCDSLERGEAAYLLGAGPLRDPPSLEDLLMSDALAAQRESVRHVRKLEDVGLATYAGQGAAVIVGILLAIAIVGAIIVAFECDEQTPPGQDTDDCRLGKFLLMLGTAVIIAIWAGQQPTTTTTGTQNISGPLPQLEE